MTVLAPPIASPLEAYPALVLNADYQPLSYFPLSLWSWQDAVKAMCADRVNVVSTYDRRIRSPSRYIELPSVIALRDYVKPEAPKFTRFNVFLRDSFCCQYCQDKMRSRELTFDHVVPRSRGGGTNWQNIVAACAPCNLKKASKLPRECGMHPYRAPHAPTNHELSRNGRRFPPGYLHESWMDYLYWDTQLDSDATVIQPSRRLQSGAAKGFLLN